MDSEYSIEYKKVSTKGTLDPAYTWASIKASNKEDAVVNLRNQLADEGVSEIRIGKIVNRNPQKNIEVPKKRKSIKGWVVGAVLVIASSAKLLERLF